MNFDAQQVTWAATAVFLGGFLKGATGAGTPVVGIPILTALFGIQFAVAVFSVLNLMSNFWHAYAYRMHRPSTRFVLRFALTGALGALIGSFFLVWLPTDALMAFLALIVFSYVALRFAKPDWKLARERGDRFVSYAGLAGGLMQGAGGISAPVSVTFLNAMRLSRPEFIGTISIFFCAMSLVQIPSLAGLGILDRERFVVSVIATVPLFAGIWLGEKVARHLSKAWFDRAILMLLVVMAIRLIWVAALG